MVQASVAHQHRNKPTQIKMKFVIIAALALVAVASAAPVEDTPVVLRAEFEQQPEGSYVSSFETSDGIKKSETGELKDVLDEENKPKSVIVVRGSYEFIDPEGKTQLITYVADETGFHPEGEGIPKEAAPVRR